MNKSPTCLIILPGVAMTRSHVFFFQGAFLLVPRTGRYGSGLFQLFVLYRPVNVCIALEI